MALSSSIARVALPVPGAEPFDFLLDAPLNARTDLVGQRVLVPWGRKQAIGVVVELASASAQPAEKLRPIVALLDDLPPQTADWLAFAAFAARYYQRGLGETMLQAMPDPLRAADRYRSKTPGVWQAPAIQRALKRIAKAAPPQANPEGPAPLLHPAQQAALAALADAPEQGGKPILLHGVTGSGKTEVYLHAAQRTLAAGLQALVLVPEINLTPQLYARFADRFAGRRVYALHSGLAEGERTEAWVAAATGAADIILGTRLAVFAPLPRLGLIIVDEEHDPSYKQQEGLRYSARDLAVWRAHQLRLPVLLGSATPSLESWWNAEQGRYRCITMAERARAGAVLPTMRLIDTSVDQARDGLSQAVRQALEQTHARGEQSLVFMNRRGYAPVLACAACGWVAGCKRCTAHAVFHKADGRLHCHHCGWETRVPVACPTCGNLDLAPLGRGTQRIEENLAAVLPGARIARIDADSTRRKGSASALFEQMHAGAIDVLVGTQMVAKGHDFERVSLVVVLGADAALFSADFRAPERLFQQLMQVAGRAGRAATPGRVLIQTRYPTHPMFAALVAHDYAHYAHQLIEERRDAGLPPFTHQAILRAEAKKLETALAFLQDARGLVAAEGVRAYDPVPMTLTRLANIERAQLLVESASRAVLQAFLPRWTAALGVRGAVRARGVRWHLEVDPLDI